MSPSDTLLLATMDLAMASPFGLLLQVSNPARTRVAFYQVRAKYGDPGHRLLQLRASPFPEGNLIMLKVAPAETESAAGPKSKSTGVEAEAGTEAEAEAPVAQPRKVLLDLTSLNL